MNKIKNITKFASIMLLVIMLSILFSSLIATGLIKNKQFIENQAQQFGDPKMIIAESMKVYGGMLAQIFNDQNQTLYCIEPLAATKIECEICGKKHTPEEIRNWAKTEKEESQCVRIEYPKDCPHKDHTSKTFYECKGNHPNESTPYGGQADLYDVGYILSKSPNDGWSGDIQQAVWLSPISQYEHYGPEPYRSNGIAIRNESIAYKEFYENIVKTYKEYHGEDPKYKNKDTGAKPLDKTDHEKLKIDVDQEHQLNKIGPFSLDYVNGRYIDNNTGLDIGFGGISKMYLKDNNGNEIEIKALIREDDDNNEGKPYGKFNGVELNAGNDYVDTAERTKEYNYPKPGEKFYVEVEANTDKVVTYTLHVDFKWLVCEAELCVRQAYYLRLDQKEDDDVYLHQHNDGYWKTTCKTNSKGQQTCTQTWVDDWNDCNGEIKTLKATNVDTQDILLRRSAGRRIEEDSIDIPVTTTPNVPGPAAAMKIGGFVFEDSFMGKENNANGIRDESDVGLKNVEVALYDVKTGELAELAKPEDEMVKGLEQTDEDFAKKVKEIKEDPNDYTRRTNPTLTDEKGYYEFRGINLNKKYYVKFTYNGQEYMPTEYLLLGKDDHGENVNSIINDKKIQEGEPGIYDVDGFENITDDAKKKWKVTSKGTEIEDERNNFDNRFGEIRSYPENYVSSNSLEELDGDGETYYNKAFSTYDIAGIRLKPDGDYEQASTPLVDTYLKVDENGDVIDTRNNLSEDKNGKIVINAELTEGLISKEIKKYIETNEDPVTKEKKHMYPTNLKNDIYNKIVKDIAGNDEEKNTEMWQKLQFIEDCKISSYSKSQGANKDGVDQYPVFTKFTTTVVKDNRYPYNSYADGTYNEDASTYGNDVLTHNGDGSGGDSGRIIYPNVYKGQLEINQGLWKRQKSTLSLTKDVAYAATKINNKTEVYKYNKYKDMGLDEEDQEKLNAIYENIRKGLYTKEDASKMEEFANKYNWTIQARIRGDIKEKKKKSGDEFYSNYYKRDLAPADYNYIASETNHKDDLGENERNLKVYLTYRLKIHNASQGTVNKVKEVVDYYNTDYIYMPNMSWIMYKDSNDNKQNNTEDEKKENQKNQDISFTSKEYKQMIQQGGIIDDPNRFKAVNIPDVIDDGNAQYTNQNGYYPNAKSGLDGASGLEIKYEGEETSKEFGTKALYINGLKDKELASGEDAYIYLTFEVDKDGENKDKMQGVKKDVVEHNWAEINGYQTYYENGTKLPNYGEKGRDKVAGLIDYNSTPGNLDKENIDKEWTYEDDADRAKGVKLVINKEFVRGLNGIVWEDQRKQKPNAWVGNGIRDENEIGVNGVRVQLVEKLDGKGEEYIWGEVKSGISGNLQIIGNTDNVGANVENQGTVNGKYNFTNFIPGNYIIRFIYGDNDETVKISEKGGRNITSYNGQDFKSTTYQGQTGENGIPIYEPNEDEKDLVYREQYNSNEDTRFGTTEKDKNVKYNEYYYNIDAADKAGKNYSDARDIYNNETTRSGTTRSETTYQGRNEVINYSKDGVTNGKAEVLASPYNDNNKIKELKDKTHMTAETALIVMEGEYNRTETSENNNDINKTKGIPENENANGEDSNARNCNYIFNNIDFGLEERPKAQLELNKKVSNVKITLMNGTVLFNAKDKVDNLVWKKGAAYDLDKKDPYQADTKYKDYYYDNNHRYAYRTEKIDSIIKSIYNGDKGNNGLIQATMDSEAMHGATIQIIYELSVKNVGEVDYNDIDFYYTGVGSQNPVWTKADVVIDYVANNIKYREQDNKNNWDIKEHNNIKTDGLVGGKAVEQLENFETIVTTGTLSDKLFPGDSKNTYLTLTQLITPQNKADELTYDNIAEIVQISNDVGRRMAYSIQGNQDPTGNPTEVDSFRAEPVKILPPYGAKYTYYILGIGITLILLGGVVLIQKKVLKKKD